MRRDWLFLLWASASLVASRTLLQWLLACLNFTLDSRGANKKNWYLWTMAATQAADNHGHEWGFDLIFIMRDVYINSNLNPPTKFTSSSRSTKFKDILPQNISQMIRKTIPISTRIVISYATKQGVLFCVWWKVDGKWDHHMITICQWRESHCRTNTSIRRNKYIQKSRTGRVTDNPSQRNCQNQLSHLSLFHIKQECQASLIQGKIHIQLLLKLLPKYNETLELC